VWWRTIASIRDGDGAVVVVGFLAIYISLSETKLALFFGWIGG